MFEAKWIEGTHADSCGRDYVFGDLLKKKSLRVDIMQQVSALSVRQSYAAI